MSVSVAVGSGTLVGVEVYVSVGGGDVFVGVSVVVGSIVSVTVGV